MNKVHTLGGIALAGSLLLLGGSVGATGATIKVTTLADENGVNNSACSLREALHVVNSKSKEPWGGCPAGAPVGDNIIQLEAGSYTLDSELPVLASVIIQGADTTIKEDDETTPDVDETLNPYTGKAPNRKPPITVIDAGANNSNPHRIINSYGNTGSTLTLKDVVLTGGIAPSANNKGNGGAIYAALSVSLSNVVISHSNAQRYLDSSGVYRGGMGGAIFFSTSDASLSAEDTVFSDNVSDAEGGAIGMVCEQDRELASHTITITRSLLARNESAYGGAGAIAACGSTTLDISASTLSGNKSVAITQAPLPPVPQSALTYRQTGNAQGQGSVTLANITAAEQSGGAVFGFQALSSISLNNSLLIGNANGNCDLDSAVSFRAGNYNAVDDASCDALLLSSLSANLHPGSGQIDNELLRPLALSGGLTPVYMLKSSSAYALNKGAEGDSCTGADQRGLSRKNGSKCDIGAVERMEPTAVDDSVQNGTDSRVIIADILANDSFGESDTGPSRFADPDRDGGTQAVTVISGGPLVTVPAAGGSTTTQNTCIWHDKNDSNEDYRNKLVIDSRGVLYPDSAPLSCTYQVNVVAEDGTTASSDIATVTATISNIPPTAVNDVYVRPIGVTELSLDLLANDKDVDDEHPFDAPAPNYLIYIASKPSLGDVVGETQLCPGSSYSAGTVKFCYRSDDLKYVAKNAQSPFSDSFQYSVYDDEGAVSGSATVTIKTNAPDPDKGQTGGSLDMAGLLLLSLLGLRRARRL